MHSTKPIHTCSDVRMRPAFITLAGCIDGRPNGRNERCTWTWEGASHHRVMGEKATRIIAHSTGMISGPPHGTETVCTNCPTMPSAAQANTW